MPTQRWEICVLGRRGSVAKTCSAVPGSRHPSVVADRAGLVATSFLKNCSDRVHTFAGNSSSIAPTSGPPWMWCDKKRGRCGAMMNYVHSAASIAPQRSKRQNEKKGRKRVTTISQRAAQIVEGAHTKEKEDVACPRCDRELYVFNTASGPILRCRGWTLAGTAMYADQKACHYGVIIPGGMLNTNRTGDGNSASGSGGPGTLPRRDDGIPNPPPLNDWTAQVASFDCKPSLGTNN